MLLVTEAFEGARFVVEFTTPSSPGARPSAIYGVGLPVGLVLGDGDGDGLGLPLGLAAGLGVKTETKVAPVNNESDAVDSVVMVGDN